MVPFTPSVAQQNYFTWIRSGEGSCILEAVAGSGKTTTIVNGLEHMVGHIFLGAYNRLMAIELVERTVNYPHVKASTFHAAGNSSLRSAFGNVHALAIDDKKLSKIVTSITDKRGDLFPLAPAIPKIVSMAKNRGIGALSSVTDLPAWQVMIDHFDLDSDLPEGARMDQVIPFAQTVLTRSNLDLETIDFDDMVYLPLQRNIRMTQYDWVLIDEAQDTNSTRRALAKKMLRPGGRLVAVGDANQCIYGFTGSDNDALDQIARDFNAMRLPLTVSYRCPRAVVQHARKWVSHITAADTAAEGSVSVIDYQQIFDQIRPGDAVVCRFNKHLVKLVFALIRGGVPAKMEGREIGKGLVVLCTKWKVSQISTLRDKLEDYKRAEYDKAMAKDRPDRAERIADQIATMMVLIDRATELKMTAVTELEALIMSLFEDNSVGVVRLMSVHKAKGLEFDRVFLLGRAELMPSPMARQPWQKQAEINLIYVAVTRAKKALVEVIGVVAAFGQKLGTTLPVKVSIPNPQHDEAPPWDVDSIKVTVLHPGASSKSQHAPKKRRRS